MFGAKLPVAFVSRPAEVVHEVRVFLLREPGVEDQPRIGSDLAADFECLAERCEHGALDFPVATTDRLGEAFAQPEVERGRLYPAPEPEHVRLKILEDLNIFRHHRVRWQVGLPDNKIAHPERARRERTDQHPRLGVLVVVIGLLGTVHGQVKLEFLPLRRHIHDLGHHGAELDPNPRVRHAVLLEPNLRLVGFSGVETEF